MNKFNKLAILRRELRICEKEFSVKYSNKYRLKMMAIRAEIDNIEKELKDEAK